MSDDNKDKDKPDPLKVARDIIGRVEQDRAEYDADITERAEKIMAEAFARFGDFAGALTSGDQALIRQCSEIEAQLRRMIFVVLEPCLESVGVRNPSKASDIVVDCILAIVGVQRIRDGVFSDAGESDDLAEPDAE
jgi:hypothetical protein